MAIAALIVIIVIAAIIFGWLHPYADQVFLSPTEENKRKFDVSLTIVQAITSSVGTIAAIVSGIFLYLNFTVATRNAEIAEDKQIAERFAKAVEQLGNDQQQVRLGGIYSLERIAKNSQEDLWTVVEVLSSFIREYAAHRAKDPSSVEVSLQFQAANGESRIKLPTDVQAAFTVLDRIYKQRTVDQRIDFQGIDLSNTLLLKINLSGADFIGANLSKAILIEANLSDTNLISANLGDANLIGANLSKADLGGANLSKAILIDADLNSADLNSANLSKADLSGASLSKADLRDADLIGANLSGANLSGADLSKTYLIGSELNYANLSNANLRHAVLFNLDFKTTENLQAQQLEGEDHPLICKVQFSPHIQIDPGRDCDRLSEVLVERYPDEFKTIEDAKAYIESP